MGSKGQGSAAMCHPGGGRDRDARGIGLLSSRGRGMGVSVPCTTPQASARGGGVRVTSGPACAGGRDQMPRQWAHHSTAGPILAPAAAPLLSTAGDVRECSNGLMKLGLNTKSIINNVTLIIKRLKLSLWFADCPFHAVISPHSYS